jgi:RND family efflux transporter MFP subunit
MVETYQAQMDIAALDLDRCRIKAPLTGIVNSLHFEKGEFLNAGQPVAEVLQIDKVKVVIGIPESDVSAVRGVDDYTVQIDALGGRQFAARKHFLSRSTDPMARLYDLEIVIENPQEEILPDMFARVEIVKRQVNDAITLPLYSVISMNNQHRVYVTKDGKVQAREVDLGLQEGWLVEITRGLAVDEHVVVVGQRGLTEGQSVSIIRSVTDMEELAR